MRFLICWVSIFRGRLYWLESFAFGKVGEQSYIEACGILLLRTQEDFAFSGGLTNVPFPSRESGSVGSSSPCSCRFAKWIFFTDGACESSTDQVGSVGGVLVSPSGTLTAVFGKLVPTEAEFCK